MLENVLTKKNCTVRVKLTVKGLVSFGLIVLAVLLPQLVHLTLGQAGGVRWLPMYLPVRSVRRAASAGFPCIFPSSLQAACSA